MSDKEAGGRKPGWLGGGEIGRQQLPAEIRRDHQRQRVIAAVARLAHRGGDLGTAEILAAAETSRASLYRLFGSKRGAIEAACVEATRGLVEPVRAAGELEEEWPERLAAAVGALLGAANEEHLLAELCLVHAPGLVGAGVAVGPEPVLEALADVMAAGRSRNRGRAPELPAGAERFTAAGVLYLVARRLRGEERRSAAEARRELVELAAQHFVGAQEAARFAAELPAG